MVKSSRLKSNMTVGKFSTSPHPATEYKSSLNFGTDDYLSFVMANFRDELLAQDISAFNKTVDINASEQEFLEFLKSKNALISAVGSDRSRFALLKACLITYTFTQYSLSVNLYGELPTIDAISDDIQNVFSSNPCYIDWVYDPQYLESIKMPVNHDMLPFDEMYPCLNGESLVSYYDRFIKSNANILILIGPPGTGKTTMIRGLLSYAKKSATLAYHQKIIAQDSFFVQWYESDNMFMVLEDSDNLLLPRSEGNDMMSRFLNIGDGLMSMSNKKIIFSTNLPNVSSIDDALTRPGRCFDILNFRNLDREEAQLVADKVNTPLPDGKTFALADIFANKNKETPSTKTRNFGFI